jgi:hypothetical protein
MVLAAQSATFAQTAPPPPAQPAPKTLAATMSVYVFPTEGQPPGMQSQQEAECYGWAVQNTGTDPFQLAKQAEQQKQQTEAAKKQAAEASKGAGVKGAVVGAAAGALIGGIASDDAGKGAAIGAASGAVIARRRAKKSQKKAEQQADQQAAGAQQATQQQMDGFRKAFSVCLEAHKYLVKY